MTNIPNTPSPTPHDAPQPQGSEKKKGKWSTLTRQVRQAIPGLHSKNPAVEQRPLDDRVAPPPSEHDGDELSDDIQPSSSGTKGSTSSQPSTKGHRKGLFKGFFSRKTKQRPPESSSSPQAARMGRDERSDSEEFDMCDEDENIQKVKLSSSSHPDPQEETSRAALMPYVGSANSSGLATLHAWLGSHEHLFPAFLKDHFYALRSFLYDHCLDNEAFLDRRRSNVLDILHHDGFYVLFPIKEDPSQPPSVVNSLSEGAYYAELNKRTPSDRMKGLILMFSSFGIPYKKDETVLGGYKQTEGISLEAWERQEDVVRNVAQLRHMIGQAREMGWLEDEQMIYTAAFIIQNECHKQGCSVAELIAEIFQERAATGEEALPGKPYPSSSNTGGNYPTQQVPTFFESGVTRTQEDRLEDFYDQCVYSAGGIQARLATLIGKDPTKGLEILRFWLGNEHKFPGLLMEKAFFSLRGFLYDYCLNNGAFLGRDREAVLEILHHDGFYVLFPKQEDSSQPVVGSISPDDYRDELSKRTPSDRMKGLILMFSSFGIPYKKDETVLGGFKRDMNAALSLEAWRTSEDIQRNIQQLKHMKSQAQAMGWGEDVRAIGEAIEAIKAACRQQSMSIDALNGL